MIRSVEAFRNGGFHTGHLCGCHFSEPGRHHLSIILIRTMKEKLTDEIRETIIQIRKWLSLETRYFKLTVSEKLSIFFGTLLVVSAIFILMMIALVILSLCLVGVFEPLVGTTLSYLCVGGIFIILAVLVMLLRKPLILDPVARMISKLLLDNEKTD